MKPDYDGHFDVFIYMDIYLDIWYQMFIRSLTVDQLLC